MYKSLQAGRALAAIVVVLFHLGWTMAKQKYFALPFLSIPFSFGNSGVEFFFVLSGFIILTAHRRDIGNPKKVRRYLEKRIVRIYPTYWAIFLGVFILAILSSALRNTVPHDVLTVLKSLLLIPQDKSIVGGTGAPVLVVAWTLQYEVLFYAFFAVMIWSRATATVLGFSWLYIYIIYHGSSSLTFPLSFLAKDYILLFLFGMVVSVVCKNFNIRKSLIYLLAGASIFAFVALNKVFKTGLLSDFRILLYGVSSALMILGLVKTEDDGWAIGGGKWFQVLGDSSYALYLIHFPLISILCKFAMLIHLKEFGAVGALIAFMFIFITCVLVSVAFHLWAEKPVTEHLRNVILRRRTSAPKGAAAGARTSRR